MDTEQLDLAHSCALGALDERERRAVAALRHGSDFTLRTEFETAVRQSRETLATISLLTAAPPPPQLFEHVLARILDDEFGAPAAVRPSDRHDRAGWRWALGAAAAVAVFAGGSVIGWQLRESEHVTDAQRVLAADDLRTARIALPDGGLVSALYSKESNAVVLLLVDTPAPPPGSVYQLWLLGSAPAPVSAGLLHDIAPTTTAVVTDLAGATTLALTIEPLGGSRQPTTTPFATLSLS